MPTNHEAYRRIGKVARPHGVRGAFFVFLESDFPDWLMTRKQVFAEIDGAVVSWDITACRMQQQRLVMQVAQVPDRTRVEALNGTPLLVTEADARAVAVDPDYFYNSDLVGLEVWDAANRLGTVVDVVEMPAQNLLEVKGADGALFHVPFVAHLVTDIDLTAGRVTVDLPEGLTDLNRKPD